MNTLVAQLTGKRIVEDDSAPLPAAVRPQEPARRRTRLNPHRRMAAAMLGLGEAAPEGDEDESIIPGDAEPVDDVPGVSGLKLDRKKMDQDREPKEPGHPVSNQGDTADLLSPRDALVAPDVTPHALEPIDPSEVPAPKEVPKPPASTGASAMDVLLGRATPKPGMSAPPMPPEQVVTAEAAQAAVNTVLGVGMKGEGLLKRDTPMPDPVPAQPAKIMETFYKYGPKPTNRNF